MVFIRIYNTHPYPSYTCGAYKNRTVTQAAESVKMETTAGGDGKQVLFYSSRQFFSTPKILTRTHR